MNLQFDILLNYYKRISELYKMYSETEIVTPVLMDAIMKELNETNKPVKSYIDNYIEFEKNRKSFEKLIQGTIESLSPETKPISKLMLDNTDNFSL